MGMFLSSILRRLTCSKAAWVKAVALCEPAGMATIGLDGRRHNRNNRICRDWFPGQAMEGAGVSLICFSTKASCTALHIEQKPAPLKLKDAA